MAAPVIYKTELWYKRESLQQLMRKCKNEEVLKLLRAKCVEINTK